MKDYEQELTMALQNENFIKLEELIKNKKVDFDSYLFIRIAKIGFTSIFKLMLDSKAIKPNEDNAPLEVAAQYGHLDIMKLLLADNRVKLSMKDKCKILIQAVINEHIHIVEFLLKETNFNPSDFNNTLIRKAHKLNYENIVDLLWKDKRVKNTLSNHQEIFQELLKKDTFKKINEF